MLKKKKNTGQVHAHHMWCYILQGRHRIVIGSINESAWETIFSFSLLSGSIEIVMLHLDQICIAYFGLDIKLKLFQHYGVIIVNKNDRISLKEKKRKYGDTNQIRMVISIVVSIIWYVIQIILSEKSIIS